MPDLHQTLRSTDLDFLQRIARSWKLELTSQSFSSALKEIESLLQQTSNFEETVNELSENAKEAWNSLLSHQGRESWALFTRNFGELRPFGLARRNRENPDQKPISPVEILWYRGLIGRAFLNFSKEPQEYAYIPDEFLSLLHVHKDEKSLALPRPAAEAENKIQDLATDAILDLGTELLAALRMNRPVEDTHISQKPIYALFLLALFSQIGLLTPEQSLEPEKIKEFLSVGRGDALLCLFTNWQQSKKINDLHMLPGLICEGNWVNDPLLPRELLISILRQLEPATWWSLPSLLTQLKMQSPDFQRPAGDYDSWFIRDKKTKAHLRGFENWDKVDGALVRYLLAGPLHWLGVVDIGRAEKHEAPLSFRLSAIGVDLLANVPPTHMIEENGTITILSDGTLILPRDVPRAWRYQIARFCEPLNIENNDPKYRITSQSLTQASEQGLRPTHLIQILQQAKVKNLPQSITDALDRWEKYGVEVKFETTLLLRLDKPELLPLLQKTPRIARNLGEVLNFKTVIIKPGCAEALRQSLAEMGLLAEIKIDKDV
ncbi:MAG: helicase-associated domain-containing protein [Anaerolineaceae bacterium]